MPISRAKKNGGEKVSAKNGSFGYFNIWDFVDWLKSIIYYQSVLISSVKKSSKSVQNLQTRFLFIAFISLLLSHKSAITFFFQSLTKHKGFYSFISVLFLFSLAFLWKISSPLFESFLTEYNSRGEFATQTKSRNEEKAIRRNDFIYHSCCLLCFDELFNNCARIHFRRRLRSIHQR